MALNVTGELFELRASLATVERSLATDENGTAARPRTLPDSVPVALEQSGHGQSENCF
jgi:hypothetical protein